MSFVSNEQEDVFWSAQNPKDKIQAIELCALTNATYEIVLSDQYAHASVILTLEQLKSMVEAIEDETYGL